MDNSNSMLGLLGMESTSFLEELARSDELAAMPPQGGMVNGSLMATDIGGSAASANMDMQPRQQAWGMGQMAQGSMHYEYGQYGVSKQQQQQRISHMYPGGMMPAGGGGPGVQNHPNMAAYGYPGMPQQPPQHNITMTPPRQAMGSSQMWNHSPGALSVDPSSSPSYAGLAAQRAGGMGAQVQQQMSSATNRTNGMPGQIYGQYHEFTGAGPSAQQARVAAAYNETPPQQAEMAAARGYCQQVPAMGSPPPASNRLQQMSAIGPGGGQGTRMSLPVTAGSAPYPHQHYQQPQQGSGSIESASFMAETQPHGPGGPVLNQQYPFVPNNSVVAGQQGMCTDGYGQFYGQPVYRMQGYPQVTQSQMMSPNAVAQMSPQSRVAPIRPSHLQSPQAAPHVTAASQHGSVGVGVSTASATFRPNLPHQPNAFAGSGVATQPVQQRMMMGDGGKSGYGPTPGGVGAAGQPVMNSGTRYAVPNYQMNSGQNMQGMTSGEMRQMYGMQSMPQAGLMEMQQDRMRGFQQSHPQAYYQSGMMSVQQQQQQMHHQFQQQSMMMMAGMSPGQASQTPQQQPGLQSHPQQQTQQQQQQQLQAQQPVQPPAAAGMTGGDSPSVTVSQNNSGPSTVYGINNISPSFGTKQLTIQPTSLLDEVGSAEPPGTFAPPVLHLPDVRPPGPMSMAGSSPPALSIPPPSRLALDDEPLSTPPPLDVQEDAPRSFFAPQLPVPDNTLSSTVVNNASTPAPSIENNCTTAMSDVCDTELVGDACEQQAKKKRKRKTETGDVADGEDGSGPKRSRKKKKKVEDVYDFPSTSVDAEGLEGSQFEEGSLQISLSESPMKPKKMHKESKTPKEPKIHKERRTPKEGKTPKEPKSSRSKKSKAKPLDISDEGSLTAAASEATDMPSEETQAETLDEPEKTLKPTPRPKSKKKRPLPTFLKSKKKRKPTQSDGSDMERTPPASPTDDSLKRRSSRVTKRQKYLEDVDLSEEEPMPDNAAVAAEVVDNSIVVKPVPFFVENPAEEDAQIVEKIMSSRVVKRRMCVKTGALIDEVKPAVISGGKKESDLVTTGDESKPEVSADEANTNDVRDCKNIANGDEATDVSVEEMPDVDTKVSADVTANDADKQSVRNPADEIEVEVEEFYVKYKNFSYLHCDWRTADELELGDRRVMQKIKRFKQKKLMQNDYIAQMDEDELFNPDYVEVDRVLDMSVTKDPNTGENITHYLVKWRSLPYDDCTWELGQDIDSEKIEAFLRVKDPPPEHERKHKSRPSVKEWKSMKEAPLYKNDNTLREYQLEGLNWLLFCYYSKQNCILADEMGLGKTIQSITFLDHVFQYGVRGPFLVIVPLSTLGNWQREFEAWTDLNVIVYHGSSGSRNMLQEYEMYYKDEKGRRMPEVYRFHALVTTYEVIISDLEQLRQIDWRVAVIDEAHRLKNRNCKLLQGLSCFDVEHRVLLTGTPLQNNVEELFSLLSFLEPKQFTSSESFMADFGKLETETQVEKLKALLKPMMLRRLKEDVEKTLAPKEETIIEVELTNMQKKYYRAILERNFSFLAKGGTTANIPNLMNTMMELRKCCNHPYLINGAEDQILDEFRTSGHPMLDSEKLFQTMVQSSGKLVLIDKLLPKLKADGHKVLIFSQMIRVLDIIEDYLIHKKYLYERIDGRIRGNMRQEAIDRFSRPDSDRFVFLLCTRAGGLGINLTAADTVIIYDSDWNPQNDLQAQARCHRIGQQKAVKVYRLITRNTYEREMFDRASLKLGLDKAVLQSMGPKDLSANSNQLTKKEIEDLLKKGAYGALMEDDTAGTDFCEEDIDHILQRRTQVVQIEAGVKGSTFAKASFSLSTNRNDIDIDDPEFWQKWARKADVDLELIQNKNDLIIEMPRQRKQVSRYGKQDEAVHISDLESSGSDAEDDENGGVSGSQRGSKRKKRGARVDRDADDLPFMLSSEGFSRSDCFNVEKMLLVFGWSRWADIQRHGHFKHHLEIDDIRTISRAMLLFSLQHYEGDDRIKSFIFDLISPSEDGQEKDYRNHTGLSAPVPRGRKGRKSKKVEVTPKKSTFNEDLSKLDIEPTVILADPGYRKHLERHAIKLLLRVRLLYYIKQEIIGEEADKVLSGATAGELSVQMPFIDGEVPAFWWDNEADRCMVIGIFKHGYEKYNQIRQDPGLCFLQRCGPPDGSALLAEQDDNDDDMKDDEDDEDQPSSRRRGGRSKKDASFANLDDLDDVDTPNSVQMSANAESNVPCENGKLPFPGISELNARLRRIVTAFQKSHKKEQMKQEQNEKRMLRREQFDVILKEREQARVMALQNHWSRREEADFYRVVSTFGVERDWRTMEFRWDRFRGLARLDKKHDDTLTEYFRAFYHMCMTVCRRLTPEDNIHPPAGPYIEPITEERANRCLARIDLLCKIREQILHHSHLDERIKLCQPSHDMPDWWVCGMHDRDLLVGAAKHGLSRTDYHIQYDPQLSFRQYVKERRGRTARESVVTATNLSLKDDLETSQSRLSDGSKAESSSLVKNAHCNTETLSEQSKSEVAKIPAHDSGIVKTAVSDSEEGALNLVKTKKADDEVKTELKDGNVGNGEQTEKCPLPEIKSEEASELKKEQEEPVMEDENDDTLSESDAVTARDLKVIKNGDDELLTSQLPQPIAKDEVDDDMLDRSGAASPYIEPSLGGPEGSALPEADMSVGRWSNQWPKDRVIFHRLENVSICVERGEWPAAHRYGAPLLSSLDSHSNTPVPGTPTSTPVVQPECSSSSISTMALLDRSADSQKMPFQRRRRRTKAEMEADRMKRMQEIIAASMAGSSLDALAGHYRQRVMEGDDDSGTSSTELRREAEPVPLLRRRRGRRPKIEKLLEASVIESALAASSGASGLANSLQSAAGLVNTLGGLNLLWPMTGFDQCLSRIADAGIMDSRRLFVNEQQGLSVKRDDNGSGLLEDRAGHSAALDASKQEHKSHAEKDLRVHSEVGSFSKLGEKSRGERSSTEHDSTSLREEALAEKESKNRNESEGQVHVNAVSEKLPRSDSTADEAEAHYQKAASERHSLEHGHVVHESSLDQPLRLTTAISERHGQKDIPASSDVSREPSRLSAAEDDDDVMSQPRLSEHDAVTRWLAEHRNTFDRQGLEDEVQLELEQVLGQRQRRRPRLDPSKIDVNHVTGDENVSVVNRATGKRITGAKAPPIRYLKEWLQRNPEFDVDPKWGHIVKAKGNLPEDMQARVLMPSGRGRRSAAAIAAAAAMSSSSSPLPTPASDFYSTMASLSAMTASTSAAAGLMGYPRMPYSLSLGPLGLANPMYAASLASLGMLPGMMSMSGFENEPEQTSSKDGKGSATKDKERSAGAEDTDDPTGAGIASSLHHSFPYLYNPLLYSQLYAQSLAAATASNFSLPSPFASLGLGVGAPSDPPPAPAPVDERKPESTKLHKSRKSASGTKEHGHHSSRKYADPGRHVAAETPLRGQYVAEQLCAAQDQSEPEDLSIPSTKRREAATDLSASKAVHSDVRTARHGPSECSETVEDLSKKPSSSAVILAVPESSSITSQGRTSPSPRKSSGHTGSNVEDVSRADTTPSKLAGRSRSRLIDTIGTKLMAQKQKVNADDTDASVKPLPALVDSDTSATAQSVSSEQATSSSSAVCRTLDSIAPVPLLSDKVPPSEVSETEASGQAAL